MGPAGKSLVDCAIILAGVALSGLIVAVGGQPHDIVPNTSAMVMVAVVTGMIAFLVGRFVRALPAAVIVTVAVTDTLFILGLLYAAGATSGPHQTLEHPLLVVVFLLVASPAVILSAIGCGRLAERFYRSRRA